MNDTKEEAALTAMFNDITVILNDISPANAKLWTIKRLMDALKKEVALTFMLKELEFANSMPRVVVRLVDTLHISEEEAKTLAEAAYLTAEEVWSK